MDSLEIDEVAGARLSAVLVHPHPDMGGDRFNHVVDALYRALPAVGVSAARFDLTSSDPGRAAEETLSAIGAVSAVSVGAGWTPVVLVGYSFGADIALAVDDARVAGWAAIAPPLRFADPGAVAGDPRPKLLVVPERDQFSPPARVRDAGSGWAETELVVIDGADHFLHAGRCAAVEAVLAWLARRGGPDNTGP